MNEVAHALKVVASIHDCWLIDYPTGRWGFVGRIPYCLTDEGTDIFKTRRSKVYATRQEALEDAAANGITVKESVRS